MAHAILRQFKFAHLRPDLQATSKPFCDIAHWIARSFPDDDETRAALRKILEAKDCVVRSHIDSGVTAPPSSSPPSMGDPPST